jgi:DUF1680 family protein
MTLKVRRPSWAESGFAVLVNDKPVPASGSYVAIDREWKDGDRVDVRMPMALHYETMPDNPRMVAILYGPMVLAGDLGTDGMDAVKHYGPYSAQMGRLITPVVLADRSRSERVEEENRAGGTSRISNEGTGTAARRRSSRCIDSSISASRSIGTCSHRRNGKRARKSWRRSRLGVRSSRGGPSTL